MISAPFGELADLGRNGAAQTRAALDSPDAVHAGSARAARGRAVERRAGADRDRQPSSPTRRARSTTAGRRIRGTCSRARTRRRGSGRVRRRRGRRRGAPPARAARLRRAAAGLRPLSGATRSRLRPTSRTRTPSAASGRARRASGSCSSGLAPSQANLERLSELIAANERDERCELMWGSPGTILAGRELGLDVTASIEWLREQRDADGLWTQLLHGRSSRCLGPAHGFAGCALALGDVADVSETLQPFAVEEDGLVNWLPYAGMERLDVTPRRPDPHAVVPRRPGDRRDARRPARRGARGRGRRADVARRPAAEGRGPLPRHRRATATRSWRCSRARATNAGSLGRARSRCTPPPRWSAAGRRTGAAATRSGRATSARPSTSPTASTAEEGSLSLERVLRDAQMYLGALVDVAELAAVSTLLVVPGVALGFEHLAIGAGRRSSGASWPCWWQSRIARATRRYASRD